jgi:hypothetical protein
VPTAITVSKIDEPENLLGEGVYPLLGERLYPLPGEREGISSVKTRFIVTIE